MAIDILHFFFIIKRDFHFRKDILLIMVTLDKIYHAAFVLKGVARKTDLIEAPTLSPDTHIYLKTENLQITGSFKVRGAYYKISQLTEEEKARGIIGRHPPWHSQCCMHAGRRSYQQG